jgi:hypothetical protein
VEYIVAKGKRAQAVKSAAKAAGVNVSKDIKAAGKAISKAELDAINKKITQAGGTAVDFKTTAKGYKAPSADNNQGEQTDPYTEYLKQLQSQDRVDAIEILTSLYSEFGLESLVPMIVDLKNQNLSNQVISIRLQETPQFKARFIGNEARKKAGLPILQPAEYIATEAAYKKVMRDAQLPIGFYDDPSDFGKFIGGDISPTELQERVSLANLSIQNADPFYTDSLRRMYGLNDGDMLAYALDADRALPLITRQVKAAQFGAEASRQGLQGISTQMAERYTDTFGVSQERARQGFEQVAMIQPEAERLGAVFAGQEQGVGLEETTSAVFGGDKSAEYKKRLQRLSEMEQSLFAGQSGVGRGSLGGAQTGQF